MDSFRFCLSSSPTVQLATEKVIEAEVWQPNGLSPVTVINTPPDTE